MLYGREKAGLIVCALATCECAFFGTRTRAVEDRGVQVLDSHNSIQHRVARRPNAALRSTAKRSTPAVTPGKRRGVRTDIQSRGIWLRFSWWHRVSILRSLGIRRARIASRFSSAAPGSEPHSCEAEDSSAARLGRPRNLRTRRKMGFHPASRSPAERCESWTRRSWDRSVDAPFAVPHLAQPSSRRFASTMWGNHDRRRSAA